MRSPLDKDVGAFEHVVRVVHREDGGVPEPQRTPGARQLGT